MRDRIIAERFRSYLPVVVDVETSGVNPRTDALLEIAAIILTIKDNTLKIESSHIYHLKPFPGANIDPKSMEINGINLNHPLRIAMDEQEGLTKLFNIVNKAVKEKSCSKAILVGHNAAFDLNFINAAAERNKIKNNPFHPFSQFDTVSLSALAYGQTVLAKAIQAAGLPWDDKSAHSAMYDAERTAELFCLIINKWDKIIGH